VLTDAQVEDFWQTGFVVVDDVLAASEVEELRAACASPGVADGLERAGHRQRVVHLLELTTRHPAFRALASDPRLVGAVGQLIGQNVQLQHSKLTTKPPVQGQGAFEWHQDFAYFPHTNTDLVAVMVMLDDATPDNGCMSTVRGSHEWGLLNHSVDGKFQGVCQEPARWADAASIAQITPRTGGISIHHSLSLHGSPENASGLSRRGVVYQYRAADAYQLAGHLFLDTGYQVLGTPTADARCEAATYELPRWPDSDKRHASLGRQCGELAQRWNAERATP
jgi:phytanoyl-CoA hydroxylase